MGRISLKTIGSLSGNALKIIAVLTMLIDHIGAGIVEPYISRNYDVISVSGRLDQLLALDTCLRTIGRIAFPVFCFLLVEGFLHTRDVRKYGFRLFLFGVVSEVPFDLLFFDSPLYPGYQNVYFTLLIGLAVLAGYRRCGYDCIKKMAVVAVGCAAAYACRCDYDVTGILMIVILYELRENKRCRVIVGGIAAAMESSVFFCAAALAFLPISMYNGTRGRLNLKYFFYWFYPVHLLVLYLIRHMAVGTGH